MLLYQKQSKSENRPRTPPAPLRLSSLGLVMTLSIANIRDFILSLQVKTTTDSNYIDSVSCSLSIQFVYFIKDITEGWATFYPGDVLLVWSHEVLLMAFYPHDVLFLCEEL